MNLACCGLDCEACEAFIATRDNNDALRVEVAKKWAELYNAPIKPEHINCQGCLGAGAKTYYCENMCEARKCCLAKKLRHCGLCDRYPCETLNVIFDFAPDAKTRLDAAAAT